MCKGSLVGRKIVEYEIKGYQVIYTLDDGTRIVIMEVKESDGYTDPLGRLK